MCNIRHTIQIDVPCDMPDEERERIAATLVAECAVAVQRTYERLGYKEPPTRLGPFDITD